MQKSADRNINRYRIRFLGPELKFRIRKATTYALSQILSGAAFVFSPIIPWRWIRLDRPIFIIGCSRSGTTVFVDMFREHDDVAEWSEAGGIFEPRYFNPEIDHVKNASDASPLHRRRLLLAFGMFARSHGGKRFLNKHPQNSLRLGYLNAIFPDAKYVHVIREGCATACSNEAQVRRDSYRQRIPFGNFPKPPGWRALLALPRLLQFGHQWQEVILEIRRSVKELSLQSDYVEVKYEDFCRDPHGTLRRLDDVCGLDPTRRRFAGIADTLSARSADWRRELNPDEVRALEELCDPLDASLGYSDSRRQRAPSAVPHSV